MSDIGSIITSLKNSLTILAFTLHSRLFLTLLLFDISLMSIHTYVVFLNDNPPFDRSLLRIDRERSISEYFEYLKTFLAALALVRFEIQRRGLSYVLIASCLLALTIDNAVGIHETAGKIILPDQHHVGEGIFLAIFGSMILLALWVSYRLAALAEKPSVLAIVIVLAIFGGAAFGVDGLHFITRWYFPDLDDLLSFIEDGAELVILSALLATCARLSGQPADGGQPESAQRPRP